MSSLVLPISSTLALALLVWHSWRTRGRTATLAFFIGGTVFGILRGNVVSAICKHLSATGQDTKPYVPQGDFFPHVGNESFQIVIGWLFAGYLAWTLSEFVLTRIGRQDRLFPTLGLSALFMCCIGYCMETAATRVGWWNWDLSTENPIFGSVPPEGIAAWFSIATDLLFPVLFIACSQHRRSPWRWLALLVFPLHMGAHALYDRLPFVNEIYVVMGLAVVLLALFNRTRLETGLMAPTAEGKPRFDPARLVPAVAMATFFAVILRADLGIARDFTLAFAAIPLAAFALLAIPRVPLALVAAAALAGLAAWPWVGARALYSLVPSAAFGCLYFLRTARRPLIPAAVGTIVALAVAGIYTAQDVSAQLSVRAYARLLGEARAARAHGDRESSAQLMRRALAMKFDAPTDLWWSIKFLLMLNTDNLGAQLPEATKRYEALARLDPRWANPRIEWAGMLVAQGRSADAVRQCRYAADNEPTMGSHRAFLGYALLRDGRVREARAELRHAVALGETTPECRIDLGLADALAGDAAKARESFRKALADAPGHPVAELDLRQLDENPSLLKADVAHLAAPGKYGFLGLILVERGDKAQSAGSAAEALKCYQEAVHYLPRNAAWRVSYAINLARGAVIGRPTVEELHEAVYQCETATRLDPTSDSARRNLAALARRLKEMR